MSDVEPPRAEPSPELDLERTINALIAFDAPTLSFSSSQAEELESLGRVAHGYAAASRAANTRRAYDADWRDFAVWSAAAGLPCDLGCAGIDGRQVALYLAGRADVLTVATLERRLAAIRTAHKLAGLALPAGRELADVWAGVRRMHGRPPRPKQPLVLEDLRRVLAELPNSVSGTRDRAILLVGFGGALRRSELAALHLEPSDEPARIRFAPRGLEIELDRSKSDQEGRGAVIAIPRGQRADTCAARALRAWLDTAGFASGPVFRAVDSSGGVGKTAIAADTVAKVVKRACERAGLDPDMFAGHSLRSGLATTAAEAGVAGHLIQSKLRHSKFETTAKYIRAADRFANDPAGKIGL